MINTILTGVALLATGALAGPGSATVINKCSYDVHLSNTPASGGGYNAINQLLSSGGSYSQVYTQLSNGDGWSIKLSQTGNFGSDLMQYEYTYHDDGTIWYDLSEVDGNPWDGNWEITATSGCTPRQAAYRYSTDDAYGMQACPDSASITVTLCSGTSGGSTGWGSTSPSQAPAPSTKKHHHKAHNTWAAENKVVEAPAPTPSTMLTTSSAVWDGPAVTVTNLAYETVTQIVTAEAPHKRHVHHPRHPHA
jgi:hypothetical protein